MITFCSISAQYDAPKFSSPVSTDTVIPVPMILKILFKSVPMLLMIVMMLYPLYFPFPFSFPLPLSMMVMMMRSVSVTLTKRRCMSSLRPCGVLPLYTVTLYPRSTRLYTAIPSGGKCWRYNSVVPPKRVSRHVYPSGAISITMTAILYSISLRTRAGQRPRSSGSHLSGSLAIDVSKSISGRGATMR